jgi:hypothetical protein
MAINTKYKVIKGTPESLLSVAKLSEKDLPLIQRLELNTAFTPSGNRLDVFFYALDGRFLSSTIDSKSYSVIRGGSKEGDVIEDITLNPQKDSIDAGYVNGDVNILYNFVNNLLSEKNAQPKLFIESISSDRREIRALTNDVSTRRLAGFIDNAKARLNDSKYFEDFRLNFGKNNLPIVINLGRVAFRDTQAIIIKLYEPLPPSLGVKDTFLLEELIGDSVLYQVETEITGTIDGTSKRLRGPNYDIELVEENNNPTGFLNYDELFSYPVTNSYYEVYSLFNEKGAQISLDHTNFSEFIHFSSAEERLRNFYYKASLLENYRNKVDARNSYTGSLDEQISGIINNFDHYDRYLYYETGSSAWPKSSSSRPYTLFSTGSSQVTSWYTEQINSASLYDSQNGNRLINSIPSFIREDENNAAYSLFVDMVAQHFDNLWIYSKAVSSKYDTDNRLDFGISKDLVRDAIENFGISLYNNNEALQNLFSAFTGEAYDSGSEVITSLITAVEGSGSLSGSAGNLHLQPVPKSSYQKEIYKRIYHNLPLLTKSKGTERGLRALINSFGIPPDILKIKTFGGGNTDSTPFYGFDTEITSSLGRVSITNTDGVVTGSALSDLTSVVNYGKDLSKTMHTVEIGFSPADNLDQYIKSHPSMSAFDIDAYIGDPGLAYSSSYASLDNLAETVFTSGSSYANVYNAFDFVRLIKFFDNSIFRIIKDFVPARSNVDTGIVIKPHILDRSKIKQPEVKWSNQSSPSFEHTGTALDFTGSYYTTNFSIDGEIDTAFVTGSAGLGIIDSASYSYTETYANPSGGFQTLTRNNHDQAAYTGELSGSIIKASNGDLTTGNTFRKLEPEQFSFKYIPRNDFTSPAQVFLDNTPAYYNAETSASLDSPNQGSDNLVFNSDIQEISGTNPFTFNFNLDGGPNAGNGVKDSGSLFISPNLTIGPSEAVIVNITAIFTDLNRFNITNADNNDKSKLVIELVAGNVVRDSVTVTRNSLSSYTDTTSIKFVNGTATTFSQDAGDFTNATGHHFRIKYSSNYETPDTVTDLTDVQVLATFTKTYFNSDAITLWISENFSPITASNYTSSIVEAMTVPLNSPTNGIMLPYLREAKEVVFEYPGFIATPQYDRDSVTTSVQGGSYRANITLVDNDIELVHITSAPYSASFTQDLPTLADGESINFEFNIDFDSYVSSYLPYPADPSLTPFVTASIRDKTTNATLGGLKVNRKQGEYPENTKHTLQYENSTGGNITNKEFYYQVNIPSSTGAGKPIVNLRNIKIDYRQNTTIFNKANVLSTKKLRDVFYIDIDPDVEVSSGSLDYFTPTADYYKVGFLTGESELFKFNDYAATSNNIDSVKRSTTRLLVDEKTYTPTQGAYREFFLPANYSVLLGAINNGVEGLDERFFAEVQDSNYYATGWRNARYDGTETNNITKGSTVIGQEPSLNFSSFNGSLFDATSPAAEIRSIFSGSTQLDGENLQVYFNTYELNKKSDLVIYTGTDASVETNATLITRSETLYKININGAVAAAGGTYSGSIGPVGEDNLIKIQYTVLFENLNQTEISSATSQFTVKLLDGITQVANEAIDITGITQGTVQSYTTYLSPSSNVTSADLQFTFTDFEGDGVGTPDITLNLIKIERFTNSTLIPSAINSKNILSTGTYQRSILRRQVVPTSTNSTGYERLVDAKIYRLDTGEIYTTNDKGIVTNIE